MKRADRPWSDEDVATVREAYAVGARPAELEEILERPRGLIHNKACAMGLTKRMVA